ncbi:MAG: FliG C-terminal domain-containing protein [Candidatus Latescibacterota bacterium]|nr:FliG C-terminal domain-containing protein [Candidatus Latescibacterota bacterium]
MWLRSSPTNIRKRSPYLSQLAPEQAAATMDQLSKDMQKDVAYRLATLENVTPAVLKLVEDSVEAVLRDVMGGNQDVGGPKVLADILNLTGTTTEQTVLSHSTRPMPNSVRPFASSCSLSTTSASWQATIWPPSSTSSPSKSVRGAMGPEGWKELTERMEFLGSIRLRDVEALQIQIVQRVREMEAEGTLTIVRGVPDPYV